MTPANITSTAVLTALALAQGDDAGGVHVPRRDLDELEHVPLTRDDGPTAGDLAGRLSQRSAARSSPDPTSFLMDHALVVRGAEGDSIMRLPWFEDDLFIGRPVPDIAEMPAHIRDLATRHYRAGLAGDRARYAFVSYGHGYQVDAVPVRGEGGDVTGVLAIAQTARLGVRARKREPLTPREVEILQLAADGLTAPEIAELLVLSRHTVSTHLRHVYGKWSVPDRASAVAEAFRQGLID
jgi:DNA-binding CsgD family transcriptional regulator